MKRMKRMKVLPWQWKRVEQYWWGVFYKFALVKDECTQYLLETHGIKKFMDVYLGKTSLPILRIESKTESGDEWVAREW